MKRNRIIIFLIAALLVAGLLAGSYIYLQSQVDQSFALSSPITHQPTYFDDPYFILGSGNVMQNGSGYSYVRINGSEIAGGDIFLVYPALNVGLKGNGIDDHNLTAEIVYTGSTYGATPYWLNFTVFVPSLGVYSNLSQVGVASNLSRSAVPLKRFAGIEFFVQLSSVVNDNNEFEFFFYIGNSSLPAPQLAHGPPH